MGHYYQVQTTTRNWADAKTFAESLTWFGMQGHLATVESASEHFAIQPMIDNLEHWIGGSDAAAQGVWKWVSGPSNEQAISPSFWSSSPSDHQDCLQYKSKEWEDDPCTLSYKSIVEFECTPGSTCARTLAELIVYLPHVWIVSTHPIISCCKLFPLSHFDLIDSTIVQRPLLPGGTHPPRLGRS